MTNSVTQIQLTPETAQDARSLAAQVAKATAPAPSFKSATPFTGASASLTIRDGVGTMEDNRTRSYQHDSTAPAGNAGDLVVAKTTMGRSMHGSDIRPDHVVKVGNMETTVAAAAARGLIVRDAHGNYVYPGGTTGARREASAQENHEQPKANTDQAAPAASQTQIEPLDEASETIMSEFVQRAGNMDLMTATRALLDSGDVPDDVLGRVASQIGKTPEEVRQNVDSLRTAFTVQAHKTVGANAEEIFKWANVHATAALRKAADLQVMNGSTKGYKDLARQFYLSMPPEVVLAASNAKDIGARREPNGEVTIEHPRYGRIPFKTAVRMGYVV